MLMFTNSAEKYNRNSVGDCQPAPVTNGPDQLVELVRVNVQTGNGHTDPYKFVFTSFNFAANTCSKIGIYSFIRV